MTKPTTIHYSDARCGAGKTQWAVETMAQQGGRWLYVVDRRDVLIDREARIRKAAALCGLRPLLRSIYSPCNPGDAGASSNVRRDIEALPDQYAQWDHVVVIITHEAMRACSFAGFEDWSIIIDEVPPIWEAASHHTPALYHHFAACYSLDPVEGTGWSRVSPLQGALLMSDLAKDETLRDWTAFHRRAISAQGVFTNLADWHDMAAASWQWFSIWSPLELAPFRYRAILGNAFTSTVAYGLMRRLWPEEIAFVPIPIGSGEVWAERDLTIRYFATRHRSGTGFWMSDEGQTALAGWGGWIASNTNKDNHYWAVNNRHIGIPAMAKIPGERVSTKIAGSNSYRDITVASIAYSAKPAPWERGLLRQFGIEPDEVIRSREYEDLIQVLFRSSLRVPSDTRPVEWNVYDRAQAEFLRDYLLTNGFPVQITLVFEDIGIDFKARDPAVRHELLTDAERAEKVERAKTSEAEKKRAKRAAEREKAKVAGTYRGRGRPKCVSGGEQPSL